MVKQKNISSVENAIVSAIRMLDNQIARAMQRTPAETAKHGVWKSLPIQERVERVTADLLDALGEQQVRLDGLLVLAQALPKVLHIYMQDLGRAGLGDVRSQYCSQAMISIAEDARRALEITIDKATLS